MLQHLLPALPAREDAFVSSPFFRLQKKDTHLVEGDLGIGLVICSDDVLCWVPDKVLKVVELDWRCFVFVSTLQLSWFRLDYKDGYYRMHRDSIIYLITRQQYKATIDKLVAAGIVEVDNRYLPLQPNGDYLCKGYRIAKAFQGDVRRVVIKNSVLRKKLDALKLKMKQEISNAEGAAHVVSCVEKLEIDSADLRKGFQMEKLTQGQRNYTNWIVDSILNKEYFYARDNKTGRLFHNISNLPRELRKYLRIDGVRPVEVDVKQCQPLLLSVLYTNSPEEQEERKRYLELVDGDFYAAFSLPGKTRKQNKEQVFTQIFFDKTHEYYELWRKFRDMFPLLAAHVVDVKKHHHNKLALFLQGLEAAGMIEGACRTLASEGIFAVSIHDSVLCKPEDAEVVADIICSHIQMVARHKPKVTIKTLDE